MALALCIGRLVESNVKVSSCFTLLFLLTIRLPEIGVVLISIRCNFTYLKKQSKRSAIVIGGGEDVCKRLTERLTGVFIERSFSNTC